MAGNKTTKVPSVRLPQTKRARKSSRQKGTSTVPPAPKIFVSHRHKDKPIAEALMSVLEQAFYIERGDVRCSTSVDRHLLQLGKRISDQLHSDLNRAKLVIGLIGPDTSESRYVLFELGAAWGRGVPTFPVLIRGATNEDVPGPLGERASISLDAASNCRRLIEEIRATAHLRRNHGNSWQLAAEVNRLAAISKDSDAKSEWKWNHSADHTGPVWIRITAKENQRSRPHQYEVRWGNWLYRGQLDFRLVNIVTLMHTKKDKGSVPLHFQISPPCAVEFGQGQPPDRLEINEGWTWTE